MIKIPTNARIVKEVIIVTEVKEVKELKTVKEVKLVKEVKKVKEVKIVKEMKIVREKKWKVAMAHDVLPTGGDVFSQQMEDEESCEKSCQLIPSGSFKSCWWFGGNVIEAFEKPAIVRLFFDISIPREKHKYGSTHSYSGCH